MKIDDCPVLPAEAAELLAVDRAAGWQLVREASPALRHPDRGDFIFVTRRPDVLAALRDPALVFGNVLSGHHKSLGEGQRRVFELLFSPRRSRWYAELFRPGAARVIDQFVADGGGDAMAGLIPSVSAALFASLCGFTPDDVSGADLDSMLLAAIRRRRVAGLKSGDILSCLWALDEAEVHALAVFVWIGIEKSFTQIGFMLYELARDPELSKVLRDRPEWIAGFVEETLRLEPEVPGCPRQATAPTVIAGVELPSEASVWLCTAAINRDGSDATSTDELVLDGKLHRHWGFGGGHTRCRALHLVRAALRVFVEEWLVQVGYVELERGYRPVVPFPRGEPRLITLPLRNVA